MRTKPKFTTEPPLDVFDTSLDWTLDPTDPDLSPQVVAQLLGRICDPFLRHVELAAMFTAAGFNVIRVEKLWCVHLWKVAMVRGTSELPTEYRPAVRRLRRFLEQQGIPVERGEPTLRLQGQRVSAHFRWQEGAVGAICRRRGGGWNSRRTPNYEPDPDAVAADLASLEH